MKLLYVASVDFYTKPNPSFHLMTSLLEDLISAGIDVEFIGCKEEGLSRHIPKSLEKSAGFSYTLISVEKVPKNHFAKRYLAGIIYAHRVGKAIASIVDQCDVVFVQSSPTVVYTISQIKKRVKSQKIIYNVQDMFPGSSIASGVMPNRLMQSFFYSLQKTAYKKSDYIVGISGDMKTKLLEQGVPEDKIRVIVNWFDDNTVHEVVWEENRFVKKYSLSKHIFYIQYAGTIGYVFDYNMVLEVALRFKPYNDVVIQIIGEGSQKEEFVEKAKELRLDNIQFLPLEPQDMVSDVYSACSTCLIPLKRGIIGNSVPSKAGLIMECRRSIVTSSDKDSEYNKMVNDNLIGIAKDCDDYDGVFESILYLKNHPDTNIQYGNNAYQYGHSLYSRKKNTEEYVALIHSTIKGD